VGSAHTRSLICRIPVGTGMIKAAFLAMSALN
jgi:hypothetical protein